jgi:hypothetical protein
MSVVGMLSGGAGQSDDGIGLDADETSGLSDAVALSQVVEDGLGGLVGETAAVQGRALAFREAGATGVAIEEPESVLLAVAGADREVAGIASAVEGAVSVLATEAGEIVHGARGPGGPGRETDRE